MKKIVYILIIIILSQFLKAQIYNNNAKPYSERLNIHVEAIKSISLDEMENSFNKSNEKSKLVSSTSYAKNFNVNIDIESNCSILDLGNGKELRLFKIIAPDAKTLNFSFDDFYLSPNAQLFIYTADKNQVVGPITRLNNSKVFNTHVIFGNEIIFEVYTKKADKNSIIMSKIGYGVRNIDYFIASSDEIEELQAFGSGKNLNILNNCSIYTKSDFDNEVSATLNDCNHVGHYAYANTGVKEANCSGFESVDKSKRAVVIIASYLCENEEWQWKPGILINTADETASNYCNSYVLTCRHCISGDNIGHQNGHGTGKDPTYMSIRFNWIRTQCDLSNLPSCSSNLQDWLDIIKMDEVIDYNEVSVASAYSHHLHQVQGVEYALLQINEPLKFKEYYNGWRIVAARTYSFDIDSYLLGSAGHSPLVAREQEVNYLAYDYDTQISFSGINGNSDLISGFSGSSVLDENGYLLGVTTSPDIAVGMGLLYVNSPWNYPSLLVKPREILDENEIYLSDFNNKLEIKVEGAERWEKGTCFTSTNTCGSFNIEDFISPATNIDGLCCFKLDFIDPNANFTGGKPYGLRVYRNTDRQETLFHTFGQPVFPDDEENYNNPLNGYLVDFCIEADELDDDNNTIIFEFLDNNGNIMCRREVEIFCTEPCEETSCSEDFENWLTINADEDSPACDEDECLITLDFEIPEEFGCYTHLSFETTLNGEVLDPNTTIIDASTFDLSNYTKCIEKGKTYEVTIKLYKGTEDTEPCVITKSVYCDLVDENPPCVPDCETVPWEKQDDIQQQMINCPDCEMNISYYSRKGCGKSDIQITSIEKYSTDPNNPNACSGCDDVVTYREAVQAIINDNEMGFDFPVEHTDPCLSTFRVAKSSCWATWDMSSYGPNEELLFKWTLTKPCDSDCCLRELRICKLANGNYTIEDIGSITGNPSCTGTMNTVGGGGIPCQYACDYLENINTSFKGISNSDNNIFDDLHESKTNQNNLFVMISASNDNEYLNINIEETTGQYITIRLFNINGKEVSELTSELNPNHNSFNLSLNKLVSGSYLYAVEIDGIIVKTDNIVIIK